MSAGAGVERMNLGAEPDSHGATSLASTSRQPGTASGAGRRVYAPPRAASKGWKC